MIGRNDPFFGHIFCCLFVFIVATGLAASASTAYEIKYREAKNGEYGTPLTTIVVARDESSAKQKFMESHPNAQIISVTKQ